MAAKLEKSRFDFQGLSLEQLKEIQNRLLLAISSNQAKHLSVRQDHVEKKCPHCKSEKVVKYGRYKGIGRYKCKDCSKTYSDVTGSILCNMKKKNFLDRYFDLMSQEKTLREIADEMEINLKTSHKWRHKIVSGWKKLIKEMKLKGIVESDDINFDINEKGNRKIKDRKPKKRGGNTSTAGDTNEHLKVLFTCDRYKSYDLTVVKFGRINYKNVESTIGDKLDKNNIFCTDSHSAFKKFAKVKGLLGRHYALNTSAKVRVIDKIYHINNVNNMAQRFKEFVYVRFKGVASKYLQNYLNWFIVSELLKMEKEQQYREFLKPNDSYQYYRTINARWKELAVGYYGK